jgi:D-alanyl-D-alanine carboxypeptidase
MTVTSLVACASDEVPLGRRLQEALDAGVERCDVQGAAAAAMLPDGSVWQGASGVSHESVRMRPEMSFAIGSITKNMVAALVLQLAEEGQLSLEDRISTWLPDYPHVSGAITLRQLLSHTSGLFMFWDNQRIWDDLKRDRSRVFEPEEVLGYLKEPYFEPGEGHRYSNTNYILAAMIVTEITGSTLAVEMRRRFWIPLGLEGARLPLEEPYPENLAHVWGDNFENDGTVRDLTFLPRASHDSITWGSAGVFMTAPDLARWTHALYGGEVLEPSSLAEMRSFAAGDYGLGLERFPRSLVRWARAEGHGGGNIGTTAYMVHLPDRGLSLAVMVNRFGTGCASRIVRDLGGIAAWHVRPASVAEIVWSVEGLLSVAWLLAGAGALLFALRRNRPLLLVLFSGLAIVAGWVTRTRGLLLHYLLFPGGALLAVIGLSLTVAAFRRRGR